MVASSGGGGPAARRPGGRLALANCRWRNFAKAVVGGVVGVGESQ